MLKEILANQYHQLNAPSLSVLVICLILCGVSDIRTWTIPNVVTYSAYLIIIVANLIANPWMGLFQFAQSIIIFGMLFVLSRSSKTGFGMGDAKLMAVQAAGLPIFAWLLSQIIALLASLFFFGVKAVRAKSGNPALTNREIARAIRIPMAPFLCAGTLLCLGILALFH